MAGRRALMSQSPASWSAPVRGAVGGAAGAIAVAMSGRDDVPAWATVAGALVVALVAVNEAETAERWRPWPLGSVALLLATGGVYACVPETDHLRRVAVLVVLAIVVELIVARAELEWTVVTAAAALVVWAGVEGGVFRSSALVAALSTPGVLLVEPIAVRLALVRRGAPAIVVPVLLLGGQAAFALFVARMAGLREQTSVAVAIVALALGALTLGVHLVTGRRV